MSGETQSEARVTTEAGATDVALSLLCVIGRSGDPRLLCQSRQDRPPAPGYSQNQDCARGRFSLHIL